QTATRRSTPWHWLSGSAACLLWRWPLASVPSMRWPAPSPRFPATAIWNKCCFASTIGSTKKTRARSHKEMGTQHKQSLAEFVTHTAKQHPERLALASESCRLNYREVLERVQRLAGFLIA